MVSLKAKLGFLLLSFVALWLSLSLVQILDEKRTLRLAETKNIARISFQEVQQLLITEDMIKCCFDTTK